MIHNLNGALHCIGMQVGWHYCKYAVECVLCSRTAPGLVGESGLYRVVCILFSLYTLPILAIDRDLLRILPTSIPVIV